MDNPTKIRFEKEYDGSADVALSVEDEEGHDNSYDITLSNCDSDAVNLDLKDVDWLVEHLLYIKALMED